MFKKSFVGFLTKRKIKRRTALSPCSFANARNVGIIIDAQDAQKKEFEYFLISIHSEGKITEVLKVSSLKNLQGDLPHDVVTESDISLFGTLKSENLKIFIGKKFDLLMVPDQQLDYLIQYIAALCNATYKIGFSDFPNYKQLDLQIRPEKDHEFEDMFKYSKMIKHD